MERADRHRDRRDDKPGDDGVGAEAVERGSRRRSPSPFLRIRDLIKRFGTFTALKDVSLDVEQGRVRLLPRAFRLRQDHAAARDRRPRSAGRGHDRDRRPRRLAAAAGRARLRHRVPVLRAVSQPDRRGECRLRPGQPPHRRAPRSTRASPSCCTLVGLPEQGSKYPVQLSGGQQQRVALARALATSPGLLLLDEPLSALDARVRVRLRDEIKALQRRLGVTTIMVTHDQEEALAMADRIVVMNQGVIEQVGTPSEIYRKPGDRLRRRLRRHHDVPRCRGRRPGPAARRRDRARLQRASARFAHGAPVRIGLRPEEVRVRNIDAATPNQIATQRRAARFPRLVLPRAARARGRAGRRDPRRLLRQPDARSRASPRARRSPSRCRRNRCACSPKRSAVSVTTAIAAAGVAASAASRARTGCMRARHRAAGRLAAAHHRAAALGAAVEELPGRRTATSSGSPTTSATSRRRALFGSICNSVWVAVRHHRDRDPARLRLRLCADPQPHARSRACSMRSRCCRCSRPRCSRRSR